MGTIYMLVGISGSGKSTMARKLNVLSEGKAAIVSSDDIREEIYGDASDQSNPQKVFDIAYARVKKHLLNGNDVIFDATNLTKKTRNYLFSYLKKHNLIDGTDVIACICNADVETCVRRQASRARKVPQSIITRQSLQYEAPEISEGFYAIADFTERED